MFHSFERFVREGDWQGRISSSARHLILTRRCCTLTYFVGASVHLWGFELRSWLRKSPIMLLL